MGKAIQAMVARLREANQIVHPLARGDCTYHVLNQLRYLYPYVGEQMTLELETGEQGMVLTMPFDSAIQEIAFNLSISADRTASVFTSLLESGLLVALDDSRFYLPNYNLFCDFTDYVREVSEIQSPIAHQRSILFFASPTELAISLTDPGHDPNASDLQEVADLAAEDVIDCGGFEQIPETFDGILKNIRAKLGIGS
jgi:hypothetical protein